MRSQDRHPEWLMEVQSFLGSLHSFMCIHVMSFPPLISSHILLFLANSLICGTLPSQDVSQVRMACELPFI